MFVLVVCIFLPFFSPPPPPPFSFSFFSDCREWIHPRNEQMATRPRSLFPPSLPLPRRPRPRVWKRRHDERVLYLLSPLFFFFSPPPYSSFRRAPEKSRGIAHIEHNSLSFFSPLFLPCCARSRASEAARGSRTFSVPFFFSSFPLLSSCAL